jgi:pyruvate/2-oxoglutarate dehydrogenase complex dihydrolipoamide dehydrogenase (E3) component
MERMRAAQARVAEHDEPERFRKLGIEVIFGSAQVTGARTVSVDGRSLQSSRIVIATGSRPTVPPIPGLVEAECLTHLNAFDQNALPARIAILGGGPIGLEFAQVYRRLGAAVTVFEMLPRILPREDGEASATLQSQLEDEGIVVHTGARVVRVDRAGDGARVITATGEHENEHRATVDEIFVATGRRANGTGLGLEAVGVSVDRGAVGVGPTLRSSVPSIWAAGDVAGGLQFTHVAEYQAKLVLRNAIFPFSSKGDYRAVPWVTYTDPEVARVGLTDDEARERGQDVAVYRYDFDDLDRAIVDGHTEGFVKVVTRRGGKILGATVVAGNGGDLIMPLVLAMKQGIPLPKLSRVVYPYPTMIEGLKRTADSYYRAKLGGRSGALVRKIVRWLA